MNVRVSHIALCAALVLTACSGPRGGEDTAPRVARLSCEEGGAVAETARVQAVSDGIHIEIDNRAGARQFYIRSVLTSDENHGGRLEQTGITEIKTTMPPGQLAIGCFDRSVDVPYSEVTSEFAEVTIVDPEDLWIPPELPCAGFEEEQERFTDGPVEGPASEDVEDIVRSTVPGVLPTDQIVRPGYPETQWHAEFRHIVRNGTAIANAAVFQEHGRWKALVRACPDSSIG